jgi:putative hemolysin
MTIDDIRTLAQIAKTENLIEVEQESIIVNTAKLKDVTVQAIMVPREWIVYLKTNASIQANFEIAKNNLHTRYPISTDDSVEEIVGYVNIKEMATFAPHFPNLVIDQFIRSVLFVSSTTNLLNMLKLFITKHHHLAIIKNPKGKIIGMVTVEDVIAEIVGDIEDEFEKSFDHMIQVGEHIWRIGGGIRMETMVEKFPLQLDQAAYAQTVAQWLQEKISGVAYPGSSWTEGRIKFIVQQVRRGKIHQVIIEQMI